MSYGLYHGLGLINIVGPPFALYQVTKNLILVKGKPDDKFLPLALLFLSPNLVCLFAHYIGWVSVKDVAYWQAFLLVLLAAALFNILVLFFNVFRPGRLIIFKRMTKDERDRNIGKVGFITVCCTIGLFVLHNFARTIPLTGKCMSYGIACTGFGLFGDPGLVYFEINLFGFLLGGFLNYMVSYFNFDLSNSVKR